MTDLKKVADEADMIVNGEVLETSMDDIEIQIVKSYLEKNKKFMEGWNAEVL